MQETYDTPGPVTVVLQLSMGSVEVAVHDEPTSAIEISGYEKDAPPRVELSTAPDGRYRLSVHHKTKKFWGFSFGRGLRIQLTVPVDTAIEGSGGAVDLEARGRLRSLAFKTGSGDLEFEDVTGDVELASASGDIEGRSIGGHLSFKGAAGDIDVASVDAGATVRSASGDIQIGRLDGSTTITVGSGDIELRDVGPGRVNVHAISGDVRVGVRQGLGVWLDVSSTSGDVQSGLDAAGRGEARSDAPELELTLNTVSGDVDVTRARARV